MGVREELNQRRLFFDGGMGSLLQAKGLKPGESVISGGTNKAFPGMTVNPVWAGK